MTNLSNMDSLLSEAFEHRAAAAPSTAASPERLHRAIRRHQAMVAGRAGAGVVVVIVVVTGIFATAGRGDKPVPPSTGHTPSAVATTPSAVATTTAPAPQPGQGITVGVLPWTGGETISLRYGAFNGSDDAFVFCRATPGAAEPECASGDQTRLDQRGIEDRGDPTGTYGTAPAGTTRLLVTVGNQAPVEVPVTALNLKQSGVPTVAQPHAVMFAAPGLSGYLSTQPLVDQKIRLQAFDRTGAVLADVSEPGGVELAQAHPPETFVPLPAIPGGNLQLAWTSADGSACLGARASVAGVQWLGANWCLRPLDSATARLITYESVQQTAAKGTLVVMQLSPAVRSAVMVTTSGSSVKVVITRTPHGVLGVAKAAKANDGPRSLTCRDSNGKVIFSGPLKRSTLADGASPP